MSFDGVITWALQTGLSVTILIGLVLLLRRPFARRFGAKAAYVLWALPLLRLFTPPIELAWLRPATQPAADPVIFTPEVIAALQLAGPAQAEPGVFNTGLMIILLWAVGAAVFAAWQIMHQRRVVGVWLQGAQPVSASLSALNRDIAVDLKLRRAPQLLLSEAAAGPLVINALRPKVILPINFETIFSPQEQGYALLHELAHIRRGDLYASFAALAMRAMNWPNPLLHIAARYFRADQEAACDATVLAHIHKKDDQSRVQTSSSVSSHDYAQTLMKAALHAQTFAAPYRTAPALALTIHHPLKERLMTLSNPAPYQKLKHRLAATAIAAAVLGFNSPISLVAAQQSTELAGAHTPTPPQTPSVNDEQETIVYGANKETHVVRSVSENNGVKQERKVEITVDGDTVRAFEIDPNSGIKTEINPETIAGYEQITKGPGYFKIDQNDGQIIRFVSSDNVDSSAILEKLKANGTLPDKGTASVIKVIKSTDGNKSIIFKNELGEDVDVVSNSFSFKFNEDSLPEGFDKEQVKIKILEGLAGTVDFTDNKNVVFFADSAFTDIHEKSRLDAVESMLVSAEKMLSETGETSRSLKKAQKELGEAMKALAKARAELEVED